MFEVLEVAKKHQSVNTYLGNCDSHDISFFRLEPPPATKDFHIPRYQDTVENIDAVMRNVEKVKLRRFNVVVNVFGTRPSKRHVSLYIGKPLGKFF